ncbi:NADH/ubiquinone/plastoquinone [Alicycliphilus sp. B1]|nr:NADH/ubiquinone/plastoquinone [Alicycliphilus sp. B1]
MLFAGARWQRAGVHYHTLFQFQLMGLSGAFLTADLFNLFVFFEILLAASYGLLLHGSGRARVQSGLHYIAINLAASSLFLIGASMFYGITGTLNMADLAQGMAHVSAEDRGLLHAAAAILATAFLIKAAMWPLNFWLVPAYSAATAPVGALFALMTKVGVYTLLRLWTLMFGTEAGASALFGSLWLIVGGMATMAFGAIGMMGSQRLTHLAGHAAVLSSGTLLAAAGFGQNALTAGLLYYLPSSTLAVGALFLLADLIDRWRNDGTTLAPYESDDDAPVPLARAGAHRGPEPGRRRAGAGRPRHPGLRRLHGPGLPDVHPGDRRAAAAVGLHRQVRHAHGPAQPAGPGLVGRHAARPRGLDPAGAHDRHGPVRAHGPHALGHTPLLGQPRALHAAAARARRPAHRRAAGRLRGP